MLLIVVGIIFYCHADVQAGGCGFVCDNTGKSADAVCASMGEATGTTLALPNVTNYCSGTSNCGLNQAVCCCTASSSIVVPVSSTKPTQSTPPPKFILPDFQIPIPTVNLTPSTSICTANPDGTYHCAIPWIGEYIKGIYNYGVSIAGILAAIILMAGGLLWLVSGGDVSQISRAKELITGSVVGLIILVGSYVLLIQINPDLVNFKPISLDTIKATELGLAQGRNNTTAQDYKNAACASDSDLKNGVSFYATGYYKPTWADTDDFRCVVAMQCSCPNGVDTSKNCDTLYGKTFPNYHPCNSFPAATPYCNMTSSGVTPQDGSIAGPGNCANLPANTKVCFKGKTYTITDSGGGIQGRRIDIWSGSDLTTAYANTSVGTLTIGACPQ